MARLMRYMINHQGRKLFSTLSIKLSKPVLYNLSPPVIEKAMTDGVCWECGLVIANASGYPEGTVFYYTTDGTEPTQESLVFSPDTVIDKNCTVKMMAVYEGVDIVRITATYGELVIDDLRNGMAIFWLNDAN